MDELIQRIVASVGIEESTAQQAVGMILGFLKSEGPEDKVAQMMDALPGADTVIGAAAETGGAGGLMGMAAGMLGGGGVMGLGQKLMGLGLGMGEVSGVAKETVAFAKEKAGEDVVAEITDSIPGLSNFI
jgi:hypothetical protein